MSCPCWVYTKPLIFTYPYNKESSGQRVEFGSTKDTYVPNRKHIAVKIAPHISSALKDLGGNFDKSILSRSPNLENADPADTADS